MVDEAAEEAGYNVHAFHGTAGNFYVFDPKMAAEGFHFGTQEQAEDRLPVAITREQDRRSREIRDRVTREYRARGIDCLSDENHDAYEDRIEGEIAADKEANPTQRDA